MTTKLLSKILQFLGARPTFAPALYNRELSDGNAVYEQGWEGCMFGWAAAFLPLSTAHRIKKSSVAQGQRNDKYARTSLRCVIVSMCACLHVLACI